MIEIPHTECRGESALHFLWKKFCVKYQKIDFHRLQLPEQKDRFSDQKKENREVRRMNARRRKYRIVVCCLLIVSMLGLGYVSWAALRDAIPDQLTVASAGQVPELFPYPLSRLITGEVVTKTPEALPAGTGGAAETAAEDVISYSILGKIPLKTVSARVQEPIQVRAGGTPIGIYLRTDGVLVVGTGTIHARDGMPCCPAENIVKAGDYIKAVNGKALSTKEELVECISHCSGQDVVLDVERDGREVALRVSPVLDTDGTYRAGIWARNDAQGIGTLTFVDEDGRFGALGHGISDVDTGELMEITDGTLYDAEVVSIVKSSQGSPGELAGIIRYEEGYKIGIIEENRKNGIYGTVSGFPLLADRMKSYEIAYRQDVRPGPAVILSTVDGVCREYAVEIEELRLNGRDVNKGMVLRVTDPELLAQTGGIVQGMSGSPIIQNGKLIGAVTHVFVNDPTRGYGIFIENMLEAAE